MVDYLIFKLLIAVFLSWIIPQGYKVLYGCYKTKKCSMKTLFRSGGMPSSHSSTVVSFSTAVFLIEGINIAFLLSALFATIVIRDAFGVRRMADEHSKFMNKKFKTNFFIFTGHTLKQVVIGSFLGLVVTFVVFLFF
jgi:uncharacterized protein